MYSTIFVATSLAAVASAASPPPGTINVVNQCESSFHLTMHSNGGEGEALGDFKTEGSFSDTFEEGTHEIRIAANDSPYEPGASITGFVYNLKDDEVKYDLYNIFGFMQPSLSVEVEGDDGCEGVEIDNEEAVEGTETTVCSSEVSLKLVLCPKEADM